MKKFIVLTVVAVLAACQQVPPRASYESPSSKFSKNDNLHAQAKAALEAAKQSPNRSALFGPRPSSASLEEGVRGAIKNTYLDPYSAKIEISNASIIETYDIKNDQIVLCWAFIADINAKNKYGAYTGVKSQLVYFKDGQFFLPRHGF